jgi:hypothetical protein
MKVFHKIVSIVKNIFFIPVNLANLSKRFNNLNQIENNLEALNQKLNDFENIFKRIDSKNQLRENAFKEFDSKIEVIFLQLESLLSIYNSLPNLKFIPTTRGWAGSPDFLNKIVEIILKQKPRFVVESSSGVSSVLIGLALKMNNLGKAISLEHDTFHAETTNNNLVVNEIEEFTIIMHCPLVDYMIDEVNWKWYDTHELTFADKIDLLVIDGPPGSTQSLARYPAIPLLYQHFSDKTIIVLDDANRKDEIIIVQKWISFLEAHNFEVVCSTFDRFEKGLVLLEVYRK